MPAVKDIAFGKFRLDLANECLWQGTRAIPLRPKAFAVLKLLVESPGVLVTKQQVLDTVWPGTFVGDAVLKDNIRQLREALNDDAASPAYIETAHRRGYRFIAKLSADSPSRKEPHTSPPLPVPVAAPSASRELLGRESELAKIFALLNSACTGQRQLLFVTGEPGIGKTTLVQAFLRQAAQAGNLRIVRGQCLEHYGAGEAYLPLLDGFSRLCRSPEGAAVLAVLREHAPSWLLQMPTLLPEPERETLLSRSGGATRERMLREMAEAIEHMTLDFPLVIVLEDLHWSDFSTLECLSYVARRRDPARLLVIGTYRPVDVVLTDHPIKGVKRELQAHDLCHEIPLDCLTEEAVSQYFLARFPESHLPVRLCRTVYRRTEGNPLFMVNLVQYLIDHEMIAEENHAWKLRVDLSQVERGVPTNIRQLIESQIDRLTPDERMVLEAASIAGMECSSAAIAAGLDKPLEWVEHHCEELARRHQFLTPAWLVELPDGTVTPRHRFIHVLYRDVPYRLMPAMRRSQIHYRIAERGVTIYGDRVNEIAAELAMHFEQSLDWPRALEYILLAAEIAAARSAHHEVVDLANRGLQAVKFAAESAAAAKMEMTLRMLLCSSLMVLKGFASPEVEEVSAAGRELFWRHGPSPELFYMLWSQNFYQQFSGEMRNALDIGYQLMALAEELKDGALIMEAHQSIGALLVLLGRSAEALDHLQKGLALYSAHRNHPYSVFGNFDSKVMFECFHALALLDLGYPDKSVEKLANGLALARELGHPQTLVTALHIAAQLHHLRQEPAVVETYAREALGLADEYGFVVWRAYGFMELGWAVAELDNPHDGIAKMRRGLAEYEATGAKLRTPYFLSLLAEQLGKAGELKQAFSAIDRALTLAGQSGEGFAIADLHRIKGDLLVKSQPRIGGPKLCDPLERELFDQATVCFGEALRIGKEQGARWWQLRAALSLHLAHASVGHPDHSQLAEIYASFTEGFETADLKAARAQLNAASAQPSSR